MDQNQAIEKARQFARTAYAAKHDEIMRAYQQQIAEMRNKLAARGMIMSGALFTETARINGEQINALTQARLDGILEGYELYGISIDDLMAVNICDEVMQGMNHMVYSSKAPNFPGGSPPSGLESQYPSMVAQRVGLSAASVKTQIDRRRLMPRKNEGSTTIYNVQGDNTRWNINSTDNSVNIVTKSSTEFFATLRERIESGITYGEERKKIIEAVTALEESHGQPSFAQRYTDLIAVAANHMALLAPFIPALTEMLHKVLS